MTYERRISDLEDEVFNGVHDSFREAVALAEQEGYRRARVAPVSDCDWHAPACEREDCPRMPRTNTCDTSYSLGTVILRCTLARPHSGNHVYWRNREHGFYAQWY